MGSLETTSVLSSQQPRRSIFDINYWFDRNLDSESSHDLLVPHADVRSNERSSQDSNQGLDIEEIVYASNAFWATLKPVALTLILSSLAVIYIQSDATRADNQAGLKVYDISDDVANGDSNSTKFGKSLLNALVIVVVLAMFTFLLVFLYWMRCMKFLLGYMIFSSGLLLALMGGLVWYTALERWQLPCDSITFFSVLYNFAIVGILSIFYQKGIPTVVTQAYLVCTSVILAWQLSRFDEWTAWALLVCLAFYDLCAVLSPCGPLKALVGLMQERNEPLPGLLYEADLPPPSAGTTGVSAHRQGSRRVDSDVAGVRAPAAGALTVGLTSLSFMMADEECTQSPRRTQTHEDIIGPGLRGSMDVAEALPAHRSRGSGPRPRPMDVPADEDDEPQDYSIKLGLGDFVFYSVLVSRAAKYGFATFAACFLVILGGLGLTLVLLAVFRKALPALPISILLGVFFYLCTRFIMIPYIEATVAIPLFM